MPEIEVLRQYQALPLEAKVNMSLARIREWYEHWNGDVHISFSGGKDSTVLAHLVHEYYPEVPLIFSNTGLEYPEIQQFARKMGAIFIRPDYRFDEVISTFGYPIIGKEAAEAIYYARRIRNGQENWGGQTKTIPRKRTELNGNRSKDDGGGVKQSLYKREQLRGVIGDARLSRVRSREGKSISLEPG